MKVGKSRKLRVLNKTHHLTGGSGVVTYIQNRFSYNRRFRLIYNHMKQNLPLTTKDITDRINSLDNKWKQAICNDKKRDDAECNQVSSTEDAAHDDELVTTTEDAAHDDKLVTATEDAAHDDKLVTTTEDAAHDDKLVTTTEDAAHDDKLVTATEDAAHDDKLVTATEDKEPFFIEKLCFWAIYQMK